MSLSTVDDPTGYGVVALGKSDRITRFVEKPQRGEAPSRWANAGEPSRLMDYQVWCGPAMGAFNEWTRGTWLEKPENRRVVAVARNLMYGAAVQSRLQQLRAQGIHLPAGVTDWHPMESDALRETFDP